MLLRDVERGAEVRFGAAEPVADVVVMNAAPEAALEVLGGLADGDIVLRSSVGALPAGTALSCRQTL